jgi:hypothetical protein
VLRTEGEVIPVEVKYRSLERPKVTRGFRSFIESYGTRRALVVTKDFFGKAEVGGATVLFAPAHYL